MACNTHQNRMSLKEKYLYKQASKKSTLIFDLNVRNSKTYKILKKPSSIFRAVRQNDNLYIRTINLTLTSLQILITLLPQQNRADHSSSAILDTDAKTGEFWEVFNKFMNQEAIMADHRRKYQYTTGRMGYWVHLQKKEECHIQIITKVVAMHSTYSIKLILADLQRKISICLGFSHGGNLYAGILCYTASNYWP